MTAFRTPTKSGNNSEANQPSKRKKNIQKVPNTNDESPNQDKNNLSPMLLDSNATSDQQMVKKRDTKNSPDFPTMHNLIDKVQIEMEKLQSGSKGTHKMEEEKELVEQGLVSPTPTLSIEESKPSNDKSMQYNEQSKLECYKDEYSKGSDGNDIIIGGEANETDEEIGATELVDSEEDTPERNIFK